MEQKRFNVQSLLKSFAILFVFIFIYEWIFHGICMESAYIATGSLWRPESQVDDLMHWSLLGQLLFAAALTLIFAYGFEGDGVAEGIRFGLLIGVLVAAPYLIWFSVAPFPGTMISRWMIAAVIEMIGAGALLANTYKKPEPS